MNLFLVIFNQIKKGNLYFLFCIVALQIFGLLSLYSSTYGADAGNLFLFKQQLIWFGLSWLVFFIISWIQALFITKALWPLFWLNLIALLLVMFVGKGAYNATRWLDLGLFNYQPSETLKFVLMLLVAQYLSKKPLGQALNWKELIQLCAIILPPIILTFAQPDLGTAGITFLMLFSLILFNGIKKKLLISLFFAFLMSLPMAWSFLFKPYQKARITSFIQPGKDPHGTGYNVIQSKIAIGSGQIFGKGFKQGTQNKLQFLPERHTDFIFSVLSEEYGLIGSGLTLVLFCVIIIFIFKLASVTRNRLNCYVCIGVGFFMLWHAVLNLAMTMGLFPVVGIPLPLLSYGGSHTLTTMAFLGLTNSIYKTKDLF